MTIESPSPVLTPTQVPFTLKTISLYLLTGVIVVLCLMMIRPFLPAVVWAIVLAIVTQQPYQWILKRVKSPTISAGITLLLVIVAIIGPIFFLLKGIVAHAIDTAHLIQSGALMNLLNSFLASYPKIATPLEHWFKTLDLDQVAQTSASYAASNLSSMLSGSLDAITQMAIMLFLLFFLYRDQDSALSAFKKLLPLENKESEYLCTEINNTVEATVVGRFAVAGIQGLMAGIAYAILGVPDAIFLGAITALFAMVPALGAFIVWAPVALYLFGTHHWGKGIIMAAIGILIIGGADNLLYPLLVGTKMRAHTATIFLSIMGGIVLFGISGLMIGPILLTTIEALMVIWRQRNSIPTIEVNHTVTEVS